MAVEIPVIVDIDGAFQEAASRVQSAMQPLQKAVDKNVVNIRVDNSSIKENNEELEKLNAWYRRLESAEWSRIGEKLDLGPTINRAILELQRLEKEINEIQELRWSEGGSGDFSFAEEYNNLRQQIQKAKQEVIALEQTQKKMSNAVGINTAEHIENLSKTNFELLQMRDYYQRLEASSEKWASAVNPEVIRHVEGLTRVNFELLQMQEYYKRIEEESMRLSDSVNGYQSRIAELNERWNSMTKAERESAKGQEIRKKYEEEIKALETEAQTLGQIHQKEVERVQEEKRAAEERIRLAKKEAEERRKIAEKEAEERRKAAEKAAEEERKEQERLDKLRQKGIQSRRYENAILNSNVKSMRVLQEQERILSDRLSRTQIGSSKYKQIQRDLASVRLEIEKATGSVSKMNSAFGSQSIALRNLTTMASTYLSVFGALRFVKQIRDVTGELEYQRVALGRLIQDEEYGAQLFERIKAAAVESPFRIKDLVTYTKQLAAYRIEQESLFDTTQRLADISAGLGVDMNRLILAYGQVRAASVLRGQELRQFTEAGIPLVDLLADKFSELKGELVSSADVFKLISERAVPFSMISEIFEDLTDKGGQFYKMQETQAKTLTGRWEKLKDTYDIALQSIGETSTFETYNDIVLGALNLLAKNLRAIPKLIEGVSWAWASYNAALLLTGSRTKKQISYQVALAASQKTDATRIGRLTIAVLGEAKARDLLTKVYAKQAVATNALSRGFWKLTAAMLANPISAVIAGATALVAIFTSFNKKIKDTTYEFESLEKAVELMSNANKEFSKTDTIITRYERLASKTERTANENLKLSETMNRLREQFPEMADAIDLENGKLEEQVDLLRHANEERLEEARNSAKQELELREKEYEDLMASVDKAQKEYNDKYKSFIQARSKREAGAAAANVSSYGTGYLVTDKQLKEAESAADKAALQAKTDLDELTKKSTKLLGIITRLRNQIDPQSQEKDWAEWQNQVKSLQERMMKLGDSPVFTNEEIGNMTSVYDLFGKLKKRIKDLEESIKGMREALSTMKPGDAYNKMEADIKAGEATLAMANAIKALFGFDFSTSKKSGTYTQDPFIKQLKERMKFMQDFQSGYEKLQKYMSSSAALGKESQIMLTRGMSIGIDPTEQKRAAEDLSKWYEDTYNAAFKYLQDNKGVTGTMQEFLSRQITGNTNRDKMLKDFQSLIQSLFDAKTDFDTAQTAKNIEKSLARVKDEIKRSETARNFYQDILDLTGDEELATSLSVSVYGGIGQDFKDRIKKELVDSLSTLDANTFAGLDDKIREAFDTGDYEYLVKNIEKVPEKLRSTIRQIASDAEKYSTELAKNFAGLVSKYGDSAQKIAVIRAKAENEVDKIKETLVSSLSDSGLTDWQIDSFLSDSFDEDFFNALPDSIRKMLEEAKAVIKGIRGQMELDIFEASDDYVKYFAELNVMTKEQATTVRTELRKSYLKAFHDGAISADELYKNLRTIDAQFKKLTEDFGFLGSYLTSGIEKANEKLQEYADNVAVLAEKMKSGKGLDTDEQNFATRMLKQFGSTSDQTKNIKSYQQLIQAFSSNGGGMQAAGEAFSQMGAGMSSMAASGPGALAIIDAIFKAINGAITGIQEFIDELNRMRSEENKVADGFKYVSDFNKYIYEGWEKAKAGDVVGSLMNLGSAVASIFSNVQEDKVKKLNEDIKGQGRIIDELQYSYDRLGVAIAKSFGSDYIENYEEQLENLEAQAEAYRKQAQLERDKGKSAEEEKAKEYEKSARQVDDAISDMQTKLSEFFSGTDITSAAQDFAKAWIDAYKEFGSTTDAMKEKFNEMVENMVVNSLAAKLIQSILQPVFDNIDAASKDGELSAQEIGNISAMIPERMKMIDGSMMTLMNQLTAAGVNLRQQVGSFTGISRNIATASEESITGLAAGINTQNFYMQHIDMNVALILSALTGGTTTAGASVTGEVVDPYKDQMLLYAGHLPAMDQNLAELLAEVRKVIKPRGTTATHYVATNL